MNSLITGLADVLVLIALFGLAIFVHELGHFIAARWCGMVVEVFSIGFGPAIWKKKINGITYKISWIPVGGYVALPQLDPGGMSAIQGEETDVKDPDNAAKNAKADVAAYPSIALWKKIVVSISGPLGNIILAVVLAWIIYLAPTDKDIEKGSTVVGYVATNSAAFEFGVRPGDTIAAVNGRPVSSWIEYLTECHLTAGTNVVALTVISPSGTNTISIATEPVKDSSLKLVPGVDRATLCVVANVHPGTPAEKAGILANDVVTQCNGAPVASCDHFIALAAANAGQEMRLSVDRLGKSVQISVTPRFNEEYKRAVIGVDVTEGLQSHGAQWMEHKNPWDQLKGDAKAIGRILQALTSRAEARQAAGALGGPLMIAMTLWISIQTSLLNAIGFIRFLCVNLAIINLLPLPVLDGGHVVFALWEIVTRRKPHPKVVNVLIYGFACLLISAVILLTFKDLKLAPKLFRIYGRNKAAAEQAANMPREQSTTNNLADLPTNAVPANEGQQDK